MKTPRGFTAEPCHGCGSTEIHRKGSLCNACANTLKSHASIAAENQSKGITMVPLYSAQRGYALPRIEHESSEFTASPVRDEFHKLSMLLSTPTNEYPGSISCDHGASIVEVWPYAAGERNHWRVQRMFEQCTGLALRETYAAVQVAMKHAYAEGHRSGRSLLLNLASGSITSDQFNERAARLGE